jgi:hypothetical protein
MGNPSPLHDDVARVSKTVQDGLEGIRIRLSARNVAPLLRDVDGVVGEAGELITLATQRADVLSLREQYGKLDLSWRRLATRLRAAPGTDAVLLAKIEEVQRMEDLLQELFAVGPNAVYDRQKVVAWTKELTDVTGYLLRVVKVRSAGLAGGENILAHAQRLKVQAEALALAVDKCSAFTEIVGHDRDFSAAWERMQPWLRPPCPFAAEVQPAVESVARLDAALRRALIVEPPYYSLAQRRGRLIADVSRLADELVAALNAQLPGNSAIVGAAEDFDQAADSLCIWLQSHPSSEVDITAPEVTTATEAWRRLWNQLQRLSRAEFSKPLGIGDQLETQLALLHAGFQQ